MLHKNQFSLLLIALFILLSNALVFGQKYRKSYYNGHLITRDGDTLHGRIKLRHSFDHKIHFRDENDKFYVIPSHGIREIKINIMVFGRVKVRGRYHMYEKVAHGYYDLFGFTKATADFIRNYYYIAQGRQDAIEITPGNFKEKIDKYIKDYPELRQRVIMGELTFEDVAYIFRRYNYWKAKGE